MNSMTYFSTDTFNNLSISVNGSNFVFVFFKAACHTNPGAKAN